MTGQSAEIRAEFRPLLRPLFSIFFEFFLKFWALLLTIFKFFSFFQFFFNFLIYPLPPPPLNSIFFIFFFLIFSPLYFSLPSLSFLFFSLFYFLFFSLFYSFTYPRLFGCRAGARDAEKSWVDRGPAADPDAPPRSAAKSRLKTCRFCVFTARMVTERGEQARCRPTHSSTKPRLKAGF